VVTFHGFDITSLPAQDAGYRRALGELFASAACIAVSEHVRARLEELGCERARILPLGTPLGVRRSRGSDGRVRVLTVARLIPMKGIAELVDAVRTLDDDVELHIVGEGPDRANVEAHAGNDARIVLHGRLTPDEVAQQLARADLFVLNSRESDEGAIEGFPISVMEAMAAGLPVVGTRHGGIAESVADGVTGVLVSERDTAALRDAIRSLVRDPERRRAMGDAARRAVEARYELGACTRRLLGYYEEIAHG
jgi:colanic acid/amylovoran biosynthesis glycosyltransferase